MDRRRLPPLDSEGAEPDSALGSRDVPPRLLAIRLWEIAFEANEIDALEVAGEDEKEVPSPVAERAREGPGVSHRHASQLEKIDLEKSFMVGDQLDAAYGALKPFRKNAQVCRGLLPAGFGPVAQAGEKGSHRIGVAQVLHVSCAQIPVKRRRRFGHERQLWARSGSQIREESVDSVRPRRSREARQGKGAEAGMSGLAPPAGFVRAGS